MKRFITCALTAACLCALCVGLVGCGSSSSGSSAASSAASNASASAAESASAATSSDATASAAQGSASQPTAGVSPADIDPGQISGSSDIWRLNGDASAEGIRFEKSDNEAGLEFHRVSASGEDGDAEYVLVITDDLHLRTALGSAPKIDFVFTDNDNCYDYVTGNWYSRA